MAKRRGPSPSQSVYEKLREMILCFELYPGSRVTETELAEHFGVSRTPIREALQRLAVEGYITVRPNQGCFVRNFDINELSQYYDVRVALEKLSLEVACNHMPEAALKQLAEAWDPAVQEGRTNNSVQMEARDETFHVALATGGGNHALAHYLKDVNNHIRIVRRLDFTDSSRIDRTYEEHYEIVQHLLRRDLEAAQQLMASHIRRSEECARSLTLIELERRRAELSQHHREAAGG